MPAKNAREKDNFRNICDDCYPVIMQEKGYSLINGVWHSKYSRPTQRALDVCPVCAGKGFVANTHGVEQFCIPCDGTGQRQ